MNEYINAKRLRGVTIEGVKNIGYGELRYLREMTTLV